MKTVRGICGALQQIEGALVPFEPERAEHGDLEGLTKNLWNPDAADEAGIALSQVAPLDGEDNEGDESGGTGALEELIEFAPPSETELVQGLGGRAGIEERLRSRLVSAGVDGLGWYVSFHQTGVQWGIYLPVSGLVTAALGTFGNLPCDFSTKFTLAFRLIHQHEMFHFAADYATAQLEMLCGKPVWVPARDQLRDKKLGYRIHEEQLANAWMMRSLWRGKASLRLKGRSDAVNRFVRFQPPGYKDAPVVKPSEKFFPGVDRLVRDNALASDAFRPELLRHLDGVRLLPFESYLDWRACPVHVVHDEQRLNLPPFNIDLLRLAHGVSETVAFNKDLGRLHIHVQRAWPKTKEKICNDTTQPGLDFKHFSDRGERVYSVRVNKAIRAHLRPISAPLGWLEAFRIGNHKEMGHG